MFKYCLIKLFLKIVSRRNENTSGFERNKEFIDLTKNYLSVINLNHYNSCKSGPIFLPDYYVLTVVEELFLELFNLKKCI